MGHVSLPRSCRRRALTVLAVGLFPLAGLAGPLSAQEPGQERSAYTLDQVAGLVESGLFPDDRILELVRESCLAFTLQDAAVGRLRSAGASEELLAGLSEVCTELPAPVPARIRVQPAELSLEVGERHRLAARVLDGTDARIDSVRVDWSSADTTVATVSDDGLVTARGPGRASIRARAGPDATAEVALRVADRPVALEAEPREARPTGATAGAATRSPAVAGVLGALVPGGGQFYAGEPVRGAVVLLGAVGSVATGYLIESTDTVAVRRSLTEDCTDAECQFQVRTVTEIDSSRQLGWGLAAAGVFWALGWIDGVRSAGSSRPTGPLAVERPGPTIALVPPDGVRRRPDRRLDLTLVRVRW